MELLAASFDWDPALRDPGAALAYLGRKAIDGMGMGNGNTPHGMDGMDGMMMEMMMG